MRVPDGIWPVLVTPLKGGEVDHDSLAYLTRWLCGYDIGGLYVLGTGSEDHHLTLGQRLGVARTALGASTKPVLLGCSFFSLRETQQFIDATRELEPMAWHWTPYHPLMSQDQTLECFKMVLGWARGPVWAYTSANWSRHVVPSLWQEAGAAGVKFSSQKTSHIQEALRLEIPVMTAVASQTRICRQMGSMRHTSSIASALPELSLSAWEGRRGLDMVLPHLTARKDNFVSAAEEKAILKWRGVIETQEVTPGYRECTEEELNRLIEVIRTQDGYPIHS